jgi:hypothetical protein
VKLTELQQKYKIYVDLDGVLANFEKGVSELLKAPMKYQNTNEMWRYIKAYSRRGGKLWRDLSLMPDAKTLWNYIKKYDPEILSSGGDPVFGADVQKRKWVAEHFGGNVKVNITRRSNEKAQYAAPNHILIDDMMKSIGPWIKAGGIGILHKNANDTIKKLQDLIGQ